MIDKKDISYQRRSRVIPLTKSTKSTFIPKSIIQSLNDIWKNNLDGKTLILKLDKTKTLSDDLKQLRDNLRNKKNLEGIKDWSNIYIDYFAKNIFKKFKSKNIAESHAKLNQFIIGDLKFADPNYDTLRKWASIFTKSVMLVHYGYYQLNRYDMKIYKKGNNSIKLTKHSTELTKIFYENFKVKPSDIRIEGNKRRNS